MDKSHETQESSTPHHHLHQIILSKLFKSHRFFQTLVLYSFLIGFGFGLGFILNVHIRNISFNTQVFRLPSSFSSNSSSLCPPPSNDHGEGQKGNKTLVEVPPPSNGHGEGQKGNKTLVEVPPPSNGHGEGQKGNNTLVEVVMHNMTEKELFLRASMVQEERMMKKKVAFMFLTRGKLPLAKLWERFFKGHEGLFSVYVHTSDPFYVDDETHEASPFYRRRIPSKEVKWGMVSMVQAERRLLANALLNPQNHRFILLSESDIPLFNFTTIYSYLINSHHSFVDIYDLPGPAGRGRYNRHMSPVITRKNWRKGSQWFEIDREIALAVVSDNVYFPLFEKYCGGNCYADEHYLATFVYIMFPGKNGNRTVTWANWSRRGPHPKMYTKWSVSGELLGRLRSKDGCEYNGEKSGKCYLFARKFDVGCLDKLLYLAHSVMGF